MVQGTQVQGAGVQSERSDATLLLGIEGLAVRQVELIEDGARVVHVATADESASACPSCGVFSTSIKGRAITHPRDVPYGEAPIALVWHKRRWRCRESACPRASFTESLPAVPPRARLTTRLRSACGAGIADGFSSVLAAADHYGLSWPIAHAAFVAHVEPVLAEPIPPVQVIGIDETRRGKPQWGQDPVTGRWTVVHDRWHTAIVDADGSCGLLAHIDGRTAACVTEWLKAQPDWWLFGLEWGSWDESSSDEEHPEPVVVAVPEASGHPAV